MVDNKSGVYIHQDSLAPLTHNATIDSIQLPIQEFKMGTNFEGKKGPIEINISESGQVICLYFAASFCYPSKAFTPKLIEFYNEVNTEERLLEIILVPFDKTEEDYKKYFRTMPWISLPFNAERVEAYRDNFKVRGIPQLVVLRKNETILIQDAGNDVKARGEDAFLDWVQQLKAEELIGNFA